jgi:hypothetical protein
LQYLVELVLNLDELADVSLVLNLELLAVIFIRLSDGSLPLIQRFVQFLKEVTEIDYLLLSERLHLCDLLPRLLLNHVILHVPALNGQFERPQLLLHLEGSTPVSEDEVVFGVVDHALRAHRLAILATVVLNALLRMQLTAHVLSQHQGDLLLLRQVVLVHIGLKLPVNGLDVIVTVDSCGCGSTLHFQV